MKGVTLWEAFEVFLKTRRKLRPSTVTPCRKDPQSVFADWLDCPFVGIPAQSKRAQLMGPGCAVSRRAVTGNCEGYVARDSKRDVIS